MDKSAYRAEVSSFIELLMAVNPQIDRVMIVVKDEDSSHGFACAVKPVCSDFVVEESFN